MRKKKQRVRSRLAPFLWVVLIGNCVVGLLFSPITVIRYARIDGAATWDQARLAGVVSAMKGIPCVQINPEVIESEALENPEVRTATLRRNLFGSALLSVSYRQPIARLAAPPSGNQSAGPATYAVAIDGVVFRSDHLPANLPVIDLGSTGARPLLTIAGSDPIAAMAHIVARAKEIDPNSPIKVALNPGSIVCLNIGLGRVILGSCDDLDAKMRVLNQRLASDHAYFARVDTLNVTVATAPTEVPRSSGGHH